MVSSDPDELSWLEEGVEGFSISAVCRNLQINHLYTSPLLICQWIFILPIVTHTNIKKYIWYLDFIWIWILIGQSLVKKVKIYACSKLSFPFTIFEMKNLSNWKTVIHVCYMWTIIFASQGFLYEKLIVNSWQVNMVKQWQTRSC